ncbi:MAG: glycosyltransferase family 2 protein [Leptolyngbya sp. SIO1E4]|nr:glycosyltransferase family 2 protein [Leptolyngbya sp. SIO1E4]
MSSHQLETPVVFIIFKRPETTQKVFEAIRRVKPKKLFVIADGPRHDRPQEPEQCAETRTIIDRVDWECEVFKDYSEVNLGCAKRVSSGLDWVFNQVEEAIILEDDCVPDVSFFRFCEILLAQYREDERVFALTGHNHLSEWKSEIQSYHFSHYFDCWGWATWRRVWQKYDLKMELWTQPDVKERVRAVIADDRQFLNRAKPLDATYAGEINSWAYQFFFLCLLHAGFTVTPSVNLIANVGFDANSTNTTDADDDRAKVKVGTLRFPLQAPKKEEADREYDYQRYKKVWETTFKSRVFRKIKKIASFAQI